DYINTNYTCISGQNKVICEGTINTIDCGNNTITIISAMYGRTNPSICINGLDSNLNQNNQCFFNANDSVAKLCNNQMSCSLYASSTDFTDLCNGTKKYLSVSYKCIKNSSK
ncbi:rhamnose-binding lectin-like, partial [Trichomycterus rosablanca]|uniref:rhamnose-binding lectin-like n=1 Tax=Trichomycterus rosablanca TaxID=2290929 RepID=UPI002F3527DD